MKKKFRAGLFIIFSLVSQAFTSGCISPGPYLNILRDEEKGTPAGEPEGIEPRKPVATAGSGSTTMRSENFRMTTGLTTSPVARLQSSRFKSVIPPLAFKKVTEEKTP